MDKESLVSYSRYMNCRILSLPFIYFGIPIRANPRRTET